LLRTLKPKNMKALTVLFFISLISLQSIAQENQDLQFYQKQLQKSQNMKTGGIFLTAIGGVFSIIGLRRMGESYELFAGEQNADYKSGELLTATGMLSLGGGIPLMIVGARNQRKYKRTLQTFSVGVNASTQSRGLTLTYKF